MERKMLKAKLKNEVFVAINLGALNFNDDWLLASTVVEESKKQLLHKLKNELHEKIAMMTVDDLLFQITN